MICLNTKRYQNLEYKATKTIYIYIIIIFFFKRQNNHNPINKQPSDPTYCRGPTDNKQLVLGITAVNCLCLLV